jgi:hypothetical protein
MSSPQPDPAALAVIVSYQQQTAQIRQQLEGFIRALWASLGVYRDPQMRDFAKQAAAEVIGAQRHMSAVTSAYLGQQRLLATGSSSVATVNPAKVTGAAVRNGTPMDEVYGRPFHLVWRDLGAAKELDTPPDDYVTKAIQHGEDRAVNLALTDVQLAKTHTTASIGARDAKAKWSRRILEGESSCGLCIVASTVTYHPGKLLPIHPGCDCGQEYGYTDEVPGSVLNDAVLAQGHAAIEERFGKHSPGARAIPGQDGLMYRDVLIEHHDGEIGPVLAIRNHKFTGPTDLAA